jgi:dephospho-CoA kinase
MDPVPAPDDSPLRGNPDARPPVLGVTGAPGAGKSLVSAFFQDAGCAVVDVDALGRVALDAPDVVAGVLSAFGDRVAAGASGAGRGLEASLVGAAGGERPVLLSPVRAPETAPAGPPRLDRKALAGIVFRDPEALRRLEAIVHPWVAKRLAVELAAARSRPGTRAVIVDCALLFESGLDGLCDAVVCVTASPEVRAARVASRGWSPEELRRREGFQLPAAEKARRASCLLPNEDGPEALGDAVHALLDGLAPRRDVADADARSRPGTRTGPGPAASFPGRGQDRQDEKQDEKNGRERPDGSHGGSTG